MNLVDTIQENVAVAVTTLRTSKLRSALTILGVVIGISTVMAMATIVNGVQQQIVRTIEIAGPTTFYVMKVFSQTPLNPDALPKWVRVRPDLAEAEADLIASLPEVGGDAVRYVDDPREWLFDEYLEAARFYAYGRSRFVVEGAVFHPVLPLKGKNETWTDYYATAHWIVRRRGYLSGWVLVRSDRDARNRQPVWTGLRFNGPLGESWRPWMELASMVGEDRGRHLHGHLLSRLDGLEGGPDRDFGLSVADIADQQPVHRHRPLHVALDVFGGLPLVRGVLVQEGGFQLALPAGIGGEGITRGDLAPGIEIEQLGRQLADRGPGLLPLPSPGRSPQPVEPGRREVPVLPRGPVALELIEPVEGDIEPVAPLVLDHRGLDHRLAGHDRLDPPIDADPVVQVDHVVPLGERAGHQGGRGLPVAPGAPEPPGPAEDLVIGQHPEGRHHEPAVERADCQHRAGSGQAALLEQLVQPLELARVVAQDEGRRALEDGPEPAQVPVHRLGGEEAGLEIGPLLAEEEPGEAG